MPRPAALSEAARAWLSGGGDGFVADPDADLPAQRAAREAHHGAPAKDILARAGLSAGEADFGGVRCRVVHPPQAATDQAILYAFGGAFMFGSPEQDMAIIARLAKGTGLTVIAPCYRLAPEHPYPAGQDDVSAALHGALEHFPTMALAGESAGATLAMVAAQRLTPAQRGSIRAIALMSPCSDMADLGDSALTNRDPFLDLPMVRAVPGLYAPGRDASTPEVSILFGAYGPEDPPTLITTGTRDLFLSGCVRLERVMREAGAPVFLRVWEGMWHAFEFYAEAVPEGRASLADIADFITAQMPVTAPADAR